MPTAYDQDFYTWTLEQARFLKEGRFDLLDREHLADEVESMGKSEKRAVASRIAMIICHLLKFMVQVHRTAADEKSWADTLDVQRGDLQDLLAENPGLRTEANLREALAKGWKHGRNAAIRETGLDRDLFPAQTIFTVEQVLAADFRP